VVRRDGNATWLLIHIEIQSQYDRDFPERMFCYHARTYDRDRRLVVSLAVLADEEATWRPDQFGYALWGCELALRFPVVKLRDLDRAMLEAGPNIFAALTLLHRDAQETRGQPQARMQRKLEGYRRILRQGYTLEELRALLRLMEYLLRLPLELRRPTFEAMKQIESEEVGMTLVTSFEEIGREDGRVEGQQELVLRQLTRKLGPLPEEVTARITALESATMLLLADALLDFATQDDLRAWLDQAPGAPPTNAAEAPDHAE